VLAVKAAKNHGQWVYETACFQPWADRCENIASIGHFSETMGPVNTLGTINIPAQSQPFEGSL
jgi:hypothetical protein